MPYAPLLLAGIVAAAKPPALLRSQPVEIIAGLLVLAVLARQFLAVSENRRLLATVADQALRDPLTGLANRALFNERLDHAMELRERDGTRSVSPPWISTTSSWSTTTSVIRSATNCWSASANRLLSARFGPATRWPGSAVTSSPCSSRAAPTSPTWSPIGWWRPSTGRSGIAGHELLVRPSVGLAIAGPTSRVLDAEELLRRADAAMYSAKRARMRSVQTYHPEMAVVAERLDRRLFARAGATPRGGGVAAIQLLGDLRQAVIGGELALFYQPKFDLATSRIVGAEALLRWPRAGGELAEPDDFLPLIRQHGLMASVTDFVLNRALDDAATWGAAGFDVPLAVNLFAPSVANLSFPGEISRALADRGLNPAALTLEITEDLLLDNIERTRIVLDELRHNGIRIAIDDFGTGYSALSYLRDLPIDEVKLDKNFIAPILGDPRAAAVVQAVIDLSKRLGINTVAEGIENAETAAWLHDHGCDVGQGFFLSPPLPSERLLALVAGPARQNVHNSPAGQGSGRLTFSCRQLNSTLAAASGEGDRRCRRFHMWQQLRGFSSSRSSSGWSAAGRRGPPAWRFPMPCS